MSDTVIVRPLTERDWSAVRRLTVSPEQRRFVGSVEELEADANRDWHYHVISADQTVVGFFNLDLAYSWQYDFAEPDTLGLRAFFIDQHQQGLGYGKAACKALAPYVRDRYPDRRALLLTVNCRNPAAYHAYLAAGFEDHGERYHGGQAGPQHVLRRSLKP